MSMMPHGPSCTNGGREVMVARQSPAARLAMPISRGVLLTALVVAFVMPAAVAAGPSAAGAEDNGPAESASSEPVNGSVAVESL